MSKKVIAVAAAAALALTALVSAPASADGTITLDTEFMGGDGTSNSKAALLAVPYENELDDTPVGVAADSATAGRVVLDGAAGAAVSVTTTGAVKAIRSITGLGTASLNWDVAKLGVSSLNYTIPSSGEKGFYVFTTSTTPGTVSVTVKSSSTTTSKTFYVGGFAGEEYFIKDISGIPATMKADEEADISYTVTDVFGNVLDGDALAWHGNDVGFASATVGRDSSGHEYASSSDYSSSSKKFEDTLVTFDDLAEGEPFIVGVSLDTTRVDGFAAPSAPAYFFVNGAGSADLQNQVNLLERKLANRVTKKRYNTLARKWNAAFPSQAVKLKG